VFEKGGTFVSQQFRIQKFLPAVPGPAGATHDLALLSRLIAVTGAPQARAATLDTVWSDLSAGVPVLSGITYGNIPPTGLLLDTTPWAGLPFVEGESLHFKPAK
jgi:NADH-quinone oxidoreductase subunit G